MSAATLPLLINILVAGMFVASFWTVARINPELGHVRWIAFSYLIGMITPVAELVLPLAPTPIPFMLMSYAGLLTGMVIMAPALALLYGQRANWMTAAVIVVAGLIVRALSGTAPEIHCGTSSPISYRSRSRRCTALLLSSDTAQSQVSTGLWLFCFWQ